MQDAAPFRVPVEVRAETKDASPTTVNLQGRERTTHIDCAEAPSSVALDPNVHLLAELSMRRAE